MLTLVETKSEKRKLQQQLGTILRTKLKRQGVRTVGFPGGTDQGTLFSDGAGQLWYCFKKLSEQKTPKYWNAFGYFAPKKTVQTISVEVNIPTDSNGEQVAGFFANDPTSGQTFLMHTGKVGGGGKGIGKNAFLAWSKQTPVPVFDQLGKRRLGVAIASIREDTLIERIANFVRQVADFKVAAKAGALKGDKFRTELKEYERFNAEFSGHKKGRSAGTLDYICYHGDVVNALYEQISANKKSNEDVFNTRIVDLLVKRAGAVVEVYEVKTGTERQEIYCAIGQLMVHAGSANGVKRILVLPSDELLPSDIAASIKAIGIEEWRFKLSRGSVLFTK
jgi:hypothetical protein